MRNNLISVGFGIFVVNSAVIAFFLVFVAECIHIFNKSLGTKFNIMRQLRIRL